MTPFYYRLFHHFLHRTFLLLIIGTGYSTTIHAQFCNEVFYPGFEESDYQNGWTFSDGINPAPSGFSIDSLIVFEGMKSGKLMVAAPGAFVNNSQIPLSLQEGESYLLSCWLQSAVDSAMVQISVIQQVGVDTMLDTTVYVSPAWTGYHLPFVADADWPNNTVIQIRGLSAPGPGNWALYLDAISLCQTDGLDSCNLIRHPGFESFTYQESWQHYDGGVAGSSSMLLNGDAVYQGRLSGRLKINFTAGNGAYLFNRRMPFTVENQKYYTLSCWIKSTADSTRVRFLVVRNSGYKEMTSTYLDLDTVWTQYTYTFQADEDWIDDAHIRFIAKNPWVVGKYDLFFDEVKVCESGPPLQKAPGRVKAGLALWLNAGNGPNANTVTEWEDLSPNKHHAIALTNGPSFLEDVINGNPVVKFYNSNDPMEGKYLGLDTLTQNHSWYAVMRTTNGSNNSRGVAFSGDGYNLFVNSNRNWETGDVLPEPGSYPVGADTWSLFNVSSTDTGLSVYANGLLLSTYPALSSLQGNNPFILGAENNARQNFWRGEMAELIVYANQQNALARNRVETYLALKYGLEIPVSSHLLYHHGSHPNHIAGIGRDQELQGLYQPQSRSIAAGSIVTITHNSRIQEAEFLVWGNDGGPLTPVAQVPPGYVERLQRTWRVSETGDIPTVSVSFDLEGTGVDLSEPYKWVLMIDKDGDFTDAIVVENPFLNETTIGFPQVQLDDGDYFTLGLAGSGSSPVAPGGIHNGLSLWLDADKGPVGRGISIWNDLSRHANHARAGGVGPRQKTAELNGNTVARFDETTDWMNGIRKIDLTPEEHSWFMVVNSMSARNWRNPICFRENGYRLEINGNTRNYAVYSSLPGGINSSAPADDTWQMITAISDSTRFRLFSAGNPIGDRGPLTGFRGTNPYILGARTSTGGSGWTGDIAEIVVYNRGLDLAEKYAVETYLAVRYGFGIPVDHHQHYAFQTHPFDLASVGRDQQIQAFTQDSSRSISATSILTIAAPTDLQDGEYLTWGHNGDSMDLDSNVPLEVEKRLARVWRIAETGEVGLVNLYFDVGTAPVNLIDTTGFVLLLDEDGDFSDATIIRGARILNTVISFSEVDLENGMFMALGVPQTRTGIDPRLPGFDVNLFPNPASNGEEIMLSWESEAPEVKGDSYLQLLNVNGVSVYSKSFFNAGNQGRISIGTEKLSSGLYIVRFTIDAKTWTGKLILE